MNKTPPFSLDNVSILSKIKDGYLIWVSIIPHIPRTARYTIGTRTENKFLDLLEFSYITYFSEKERKTEKIIKCISILDTLKFLIYISWEAKYISHKHYENISINLENVGKMFGGWKKQLKEVTFGDKKPSHCRDSNDCRG